MKISRHGRCDMIVIGTNLNDSKEIELSDRSVLIDWNDRLISLKKN